MLAFKPGQEGSVNERSCEDNEGAVAVKVCTRLKDTSNWNKRDRRMGGCGYEGQYLNSGFQEVLELFLVITFIWVWKSKVKQRHTSS